MLVYSFVRLYRSKNIPLEFWTCWSSGKLQKEPQTWSSGRFNANNTSVILGLLLTLNLARPHPMAIEHITNRNDQTDIHQSPPPRLTWQCMVKIKIVFCGCCCCNTFNLGIKWIMCFLFCDFFLSKEP